ncbi:MAG: sugar phosphate isomerase/epimerase family protein, partial [Thermoguttaceae bacterium]
LENVWNNLWCDPALLNAFIRSFASPWVGSYFDLGNFVKYQPTENWLTALGKGIIFKLHFKDFLVDHSLPNSGTFVPVGHGSNDWVKIRDILEDLEYNGFVTIEFEESESTKLSDKQQVQKFHNFFAGVDILKGVE